MQSIDEQLRAINTRLAKVEEQISKLVPTSIKREQTAHRIENETPLPSTPNSINLTQISSSKLLGIAGIVCFVLAAGFIIKLSIDSGWLNPTRQIFIAALFGFSLIISGMRLLGIDRAYASLLPAAGVVILYLTTLAAHLLYFLISPEIALVITSGISLLCIAIYLNIKHDIYPFIAMIGAYLAPILLAFDVNSIFTLSYFCICSLTFAIISYYVKSRALTIIAAYLAIVTTANIGNGMYQTTLQNTIIAFALAFQFFIFSCATLIYSKLLKSPLTEIESWSFFPVLLVFYVYEYNFLYLINNNLAAWLSLCFAIFLIALYISAKKTFATNNLMSQPMIITFAALVCFHAGYIELLPHAGGPWLFALLMIGLAYLPLQSLYKKEDRIPFLIISLLVFIIVNVEYIRMLWDLYHRVPNLSLIPVILSIASIWILAIRQKSFLAQDEGYSYVCLGAAHLLTIMALYNITTDISSLAVSISWLVYAITIIVIAFMRKDKLMANSALFILGLATGKALLYDAASTPTIVRIACLLLTGLVLYASGYLFKLIAAWKTDVE